MHGTRWLPWLCAAVLAVSGACNRGENAADADKGPDPSTPVAAGLPALELRADTADLLLTWIDERGDFHVTTQIEDVPQANRAEVRVVVTTRTEGTGDSVYVANLSNPREDGTYAVATLSRAAWDEKGAERRTARLEALAPGVASAKPPPAPSQATAVGVGTVTATIYGADWCKPCHDAEGYLKSLGVKVTKKDIEKSRAAHAEMTRKLSKIGRSGASIPVIDVGGRLLVGFSPGALREAVDAARGATTL